MNDRESRRESGFTLIEVLVVLSVIAALIVVAAPLLFTTQMAGETAAVQADIQSIKVAVKSWINRPDQGDAPPSSLAEAGFTSTNDTNEGIEALVALLGSEESTMNPFGDEAKLINIDNDKDPKRQTYMKSKQLFEWSDAWGNPLIYFRLRDFDDNPDAKVRYVTASGDVIEVGPIKSEKTGSFGGALDGFQIISLGPDEEFGTDDDVVSWKSN